MGIQGTGSESDQPIYRADLQKGLQVFEESFKEMEQTKQFPQKKQMLEKAAEESLLAIQNAAKGLMNQKLVEMKNQLDKDFHAYVENPSQKAEEKVQKDIQSMKEQIS